MFNILIVDDEEFNRELVVFALEEVRSEYEITIFEAENGKQALNQLKKNKIDIVFMDIMMPIMNGIEAVEHIKKDPSLKDVIIIALTALDDKETRRTLFRMSINDFITKPFDALELIVKTKAYLSLKAMLQGVHQNNTFTLKEENVEEKKDGIIIIKDDKDLMKFWKCIKNHEAVFEHKLDINTFMSLLYAFYMKYKTGFKIHLFKNNNEKSTTDDNSEIHLSEDDNELHFSITNKTLASYVLNNEVVNKYEIDIDEVTFKIDLKADFGHISYHCDYEFRVFEEIINEN